MKQILVVQLARLGDLLQSKRLILSVLAEQDAEVHLLVDEGLRELAGWLYPACRIHGIGASATGMDRRVPIGDGMKSNGGHGSEKASDNSDGNNSPQSVFSDALVTGRLLATCRQSLHEIPVSSIDDVYFLNSTPLTYALARLFEPEQCHGFWSSGGQAGRDNWVSLVERFTEHRPSTPLNLIDYWGYFHPHPIAPSQVNPIARMANSGRIGVVLSGQQARRSLPPAVLAPCLQAIFQARNGPVFVLLGTKQEKRLAREIMGLLPATLVQRVEDLTGKTSLRDLPDVFAGLDMVLTPDTGLMHMAAHCGVPVQAFFLSSAWCFETGPYGLGHKIWQSVEACSPCLETEPCPHNVRCLNVFRNPAFLTYLSGRFDERWAQGLCGFVGNFDALGATYSLVDGEDSHASLRNQKRGLLRERVTRQLESLTREAGELVYRERDWVLPERIMKES